MAVGTTAATLLLCLVTAVTGGTECQDDFLIREGTIIRTKDSRRRGAVFLNITEVSETARCLQACCDRAACNAAIFNQKTRSCFLFDCGPLDDYRCLFTSHSQFVSATLRLSRGQLDLAQWGSQSRHEAELTSLKKSPPQETQRATPSYQKTLEKPLKEIIQPPATAPTASKASSRCSRFHFECHSGECIAIYNACDGIPQCVDGSDEAVELECPAGPRPARPPVTEQTGVAGSAAGQSAPQPAPAPPPEHIPAAVAGDEPEAGWDQTHYHPVYADSLQPGDIFSHRQQGVLGRLSHFPAVAGAPHPHHAAPSASNYQQYDKPAGYQPPPAFYDDIYQNWVGRIPSGYSSPYDPAPARYDLLPPLRPAYMDRRPQAEVPPAGQIGGRLEQAAPPAGWPPDQTAGGRETGDGVVPPVAEAPEDRPLSVDHRPSPQRTPQAVTQAPPASAFSNTTTGVTQAPTTDSQTPESTVAPAATLPPTKRAPPVVDEVEFSLSGLRAQAALQSAESQGAAIVLTLGVLLTSVLVVLALCRMQCVRQASRRGDRPGLAHDADYLVNGMYL